MEVDEEAEEAEVGHKIKECIQFMLMLPSSIHTITNQELLLALFDLGSSHTWISCGCLPKGIQGQATRTIMSQTSAGPL